jgi:hypothetical protein
MKTSILLSLASSVLVSTLAASAHADEVYRVAFIREGAQTTVVGAPAQPVDVVVTTNSKEEHPVEQRGLNLRLALGLDNAAGNIMTGIESAGARVSGEATVGYTVVRHFSLEAGLFLSTGKSKGFCDGCSAASLAIPTRLIFDFDSRKSGFYLGGGVNWLPRTGFSAEGSSKTIGASATNGWNLVLGYRLPILGGDLNKTSGSANPIRHVVDFRASGNLVSYDTVSVNDQSANIPDAARRMSVMAGVSASWLFTL